MQPKIHSEPTIVYPESDGKLIAESDRHRKLMIKFIQMLEHYFRNMKDVYVSGNLLIYYEERHPMKCVAPEMFVIFGVAEKPRRTYLNMGRGAHPRFCAGGCEPKHASARHGV